jgi:hypothetical protein
MSGGSRFLETWPSGWLNLAACRGTVTSADEDIFFAPDLDELGRNRGAATRVPPLESGRRWPSVTVALSRPSAWHTP